jgi:lysophospholipase L1-like esterase
MPRVRALGRGLSGVAGGRRRAFSPSDVPGLQTWLKADVDVYSDAGVTPAVNGGSVYQWSDQSGNNAHILQSVSANRPTFRAPVSGDIGSIVFAAGQFLTNTAAFVGSATKLAFYLLLESIGNDGSVMLDTNQGTGLAIYKNSNIFANSYGTSETYAVQQNAIMELIYDGTQATSSDRIKYLSNGYAWPLSAPSASLPTALPSTQGVTLGRKYPTGYDWVGAIREMLVYSGSDYAVHRGDILAYLNTRNAVGTRKNLLVVGDSISVLPLGTSWPTQAQTDLTAAWQIVNFGRSGSLTSDFATGLPSMTRPPTGHPKDVAVVLIGRNDCGSAAAATIFANLSTIWATVRADGRKVIACSVFASNGINNTTRTDLNVLIAAASAQWDTFVDLAADARLATYTNLTYFQADGIHPTTAGATVIASLIEPAVLGV